MKRNAFAFFESSSTRFANIVVQRSKSRNTKIKFTIVLQLNIFNNSKRVREYIFVTMNRILFKTHEAQLWQEVIN